DSIRKLSQFYNAQNPSKNDPEKLLNLLKNIPSDLEDICSRQGITPFIGEGIDFDPTRQRVLKKIETQEKEKDKKVAESIHPGYEWDGDMIRPEMVAVYDYINPLPDTEMRNSDE
ncbi:nucleotide exchange factor GrpE, partial [Desulfobacterales bacterium HSG17]|nr:nucleotide exchange factor GrpE [Desulfobacterales bacterium HSG17]